MLSALAIIKPKADLPQPPPKKAPKKKKKKIPSAYDDTTMAFSDFTPLPPEKNVPVPAPVHELAFGAGEVDPEPDEVDEWQEMMKAAEEDASEWDDTESRTDVAQSSEFEEDDFPAAEEPMRPPWSQSHRKTPVVAKAKVFGGTPLDFDDEFVP